MVLRQRPKDNQIGAEVKVDIFVVDIEIEVEMLLVAGEETLGFRAEAEEGMLEEEWDRDLVEGMLHHLTHLRAMCAGYMAIWPVTIPKTRQLLEEVVPPIAGISLNSCIKAHPGIGVEEGVLVSAG